MKFLRNLLATLTGLVIFTILSFFIGIGIISGLVASSEQEVIVFFFLKTIQCFCLT